MHILLYLLTLSTAAAQEIHPRRATRHSRDINPAIQHQPRPTNTNVQDTSISRTPYQPHLVNGNIQGSPRFQPQSPNSSDVVGGPIMRTIGFVTGANRAHRARIRSRHRMQAIRSRGRAHHRLLAPTPAEFLNGHSDDDKYVDQPEEALEMHQEPVLGRQQFDQGMLQQHVQDLQHLDHGSRGQHVSSQYPQSPNFGPQNLAHPQMQLNPDFVREYGQHPLEHTQPISDYRNFEQRLEGGFDQREDAQGCNNRLIITPVSPRKLSDMIPKNWKPSYDSSLHSSGNLDSGDLFSVIPGQWRNDYQANQEIYHQYEIKPMSFQLDDESYSRPSNPNSYLPNQEVHFQYQPRTAAPSLRTDQEVDQIEIGPTSLQPEHEPHFRSRNTPPFFETTDQDSFQFDNEARVAEPSDPRHFHHKKHWKPYHKGLNFFPPPIPYPGSTESGSSSSQGFQHQNPAFPPPLPSSIPVESGSTSSQSFQSQPFPTHSSSTSAESGSTFFQPQPSPPPFSSLPTQPDSSSFGHTFQPHEAPITINKQFTTVISPSLPSNNFQVSQVTGHQNSAAQSQSNAIDVHGSFSNVNTQHSLVFGDSNAVTQSQSNQAIVGSPYIIQFPRRTADNYDFYLRHSYDDESEPRMRKRSPKVTRRSPNIMKVSNLNSSELAEEALEKQKNILEYLAEYAKEDKELLLLSDLENNVVSDMVQNLGRYRAKRELPLVKLLVNPNSKVDVPQTVSNLGATVKQSLENERAPLYHIKNIVGSAKNAALATAKIPPQNLIIPSQYKIVEKTKPEAVGAINPSLIPKRGFVPVDFETQRRIEEEVEHSRMYGTSSVEPAGDFYSTYQKVGEMLRDSVQSGQNALQHVGDMVHSARKVVHTSRQTAPQLLLPLKKIVSTQKQPVRSRPGIVAMSRETVGAQQGRYDPELVSLGNIMDSLGIPSPNPQVGKATPFFFPEDRGGGGRNPKVGGAKKPRLFPGNKRPRVKDSKIGAARPFYHPKVGKKRYHSNGARQNIKSLKKVKDRVGANSLKDFILKMRHNIQTAVRRRHSQREAPQQTPMVGSRGGFEETTQSKSDYPKRYSAVWDESLGALSLEPLGSVKDTMAQVVGSRKPSNLIESGPALRSGFVEPDRNAVPRRTFIGPEEDSVSRSSNLVLGDSSQRPRIGFKGPEGPVSIRNYPGFEERGEPGPNDPVSRNENPPVVGGLYLGLSPRSKGGFAREEENGSPNPNGAFVTGARGDRSRPSGPDPIADKQAGKLRTNGPVPRNENSPVPVVGGLYLGLSPRSKGGFAREEENDSPNPNGGFVTRARGDRSRPSGPGPIADKQAGKPRPNDPVPRNENPPVVSGLYLGPSPRSKGGFARAEENGSPNPNRGFVTRARDDQSRPSSAAPIDGSERQRSPFKEPKGSGASRHSPKMEQDGAPRPNNPTLKSEEPEAPLGGGAFIEPYCPCEFPSNPTALGRSDDESSKSDRAPSGTKLCSCRKSTARYVGDSSGNLGQTSRYPTRYRAVWNKQLGGYQLRPLVNDQLGQSRSKPTQQEQISDFFSQIQNDESANQPLETTGLALPSRLLKPFMNQPSRSALHDYFENNGDAFEANEFEYSQQRRFKRPNGREASVTAINPVMFKKIFNESLQVTSPSPDPWEIFHSSVNENGSMDHLNLRTEKVGSLRSDLGGKGEEIMEKSSSTNPEAAQGLESARSMKVPKKLMEPFMGKGPKRDGYSYGEMQFVPVEPNY